MLKENITIVDTSRFYCQDCISGAKPHIENDSVDLIITDPPYGIEGDTLHKHYNRNEKFVVDGYVEIPKEHYANFSIEWIKQAERILKPGGSLFIVSGYTNLYDILHALRQTTLKEVNHIIWKYNFGVNTTRKFVSSHYHILFYEKPGKKRVFNLNARFGSKERTEDDRSKLYKDLEDVWVINREYKPGKVKNKNELPFELLSKIIQYCSSENDIVCDFFLGSFSTAKVAKGLNRIPMGFEINRQAFDYQVKEIQKIESGSMFDRIKTGTDDSPQNQCKPWNDQEINSLIIDYNFRIESGSTKRDAIAFLCEKYGRGRFSIINVLKKHSL